MTQLTNQSPASTYGDLLTCTNSGQGLKVAQTNLQDGLGNNSPILIATTSVNFDRGLGQFQLDGVAMTANSVDINSMCQPNPIALGNAYFKVPVGTNAQRPGGPQAGYFRFNSDITDLEFYTGATWQSISAGSTITSVTGTANQITVTNPTTTPVISLPENLVSIKSITSSDAITLNGDSASLEVGNGIVNLSANLFELNNGCTLQLYNSANTFNTSFISIASEDAVYFLPATNPANINSALICGVGNVMSWEQVQIIVNKNIVGSVTLEKNSRNVINSGGIATLLLPALCSVGDIIKVVGNLNGWIIVQHVNQIIHFLNQSTTLGISGSLASSSARDCVELTCVVANTEFVVSSPVGNLVVT